MLLTIRFLQQCSLQFVAFSGVEWLFADRQQRGKAVVHLRERHRISRPFYGETSLFFLELIVGFQPRMVDFTQL